MASGKTSRNITWHGGLVSAERRAELLGQRGCVVWLTGLSGSGKSTLARALENQLMADHRAAYVLDGDNLRHGLNRDLGFSPEDRDENIRRVGEVAALMADSGLITITAFISPYRAARQRAREAAGAAPFVEVFLDVPIEVCRQRDPKGLYAKAQAGKLNQFTGVDAPYEPPEKADVVIDTAAKTVDECVATVYEHLVERGVLWVSVVSGQRSEGRDQRSEVRGQKSEIGSSADLCPLTSDSCPPRTPSPGTPSTLASAFVDNTSADKTACPPHSTLLVAPSLPKGSPRRGEGKGRGRGKA